MLLISRSACTPRHVDRSVSTPGRVWVGGAEMTCKPRVSMVVSVFERVDLLRKALVSIACQRSPVHEIILTDDGSSCDVAEQIGPLACDLGITTILVRQTRAGFRLARARNNAIRVATGDYLIFSDQDVVLPPGFVTQHLIHARPGQFLVAYPVRLTEAQSRALDERAIRSGTLAALVTERQRRKVVHQYWKDRLYTVLHSLRVRRIGPKLRGGAFGVFAHDLRAVNGFDEEYEGWGNEDDDLGLRLYQSGMRGRNVFREQFPLHLWHPSNSCGTRANLAYYRRRRREIRQGQTSCVHGLSRPSGSDAPTVTVLVPPGSTHGSNT